jgi:acyl dehydratase/NAD(P)-dependent dehydrogenase (short-subunit alcohol dehydrogenase family)
VPLRLRHVSVTNSRRFTLEDQKQFAELSGDANPVHLDSSTARRTQAGTIVVHGMHMLLWSLDKIAASTPSIVVPKGIRVDFLSFLPVNAEATLGELSTGSVTQATLTTNGAPVMTIELRNTSSRWADRPVQKVSAEVWAPNDPRPLEFAEIDGQSGAVAFASTAEDVSRNYPSAAAWLGGQRLAALACCSRLVGMVCPGLFSIFNRIEVDLVEPSESPTLQFAATVDARFRVVREAVSGGGIRGNLLATARNPPTSQPAMSDIADRLSPGEFSDATALIIGGSRGLGELTAKILASGGAALKLTYASGLADAERVCGELLKHGARCDVLKFDASQPLSEDFVHQLASITHCYYFATPPIFQPSAGIFSKERYDRFFRFYVEAFHEVCTAFSKKGSGQVRVLYPSSTAVSDRPSRMLEYAMAKASGEVLCDEINKRLENVTVICSRLPRLPTDQTASALASAFTSKMANSIDILLPLIRQVQSPR